MLVAAIPLGDELDLDALEALLRRRHARRFALRIHFNPQTFVEGFDMARITTEQARDVTVVPKTQGGAIARIDGEVAFSSSDEAVAVVNKTGPASAEVIGVGEGVAQIRASFDADLGAGVRQVELTGAVEVVAAEAVTGELVFGEPRLQ